MFHHSYVGLCPALNSALHLFWLKCFPFSAAKELYVMVVSGFCVMSCVISVCRKKQRGEWRFVGYLSFVMLSFEPRFANM